MTKKDVFEMFDRLDVLLKDSWEQVGVTAFAEEAKKLLDAERAQEDTILSAFVSDQEPEKREEAALWIKSYITNAQDRYLCGALTEKHEALAVQHPEDAAIESEKARKFRVERSVADKKCSQILQAIQDLLPEKETVEDFLRNNPDVTVDMMTPGGYVHLDPKQGQELLTGSGILAHPGAAEAFVEIDAKTLLEQEIHSMNRDKNDKNHFYLLTEIPEQARKKDQSLLAAEDTSSNVKPTPPRGAHL